MDAEIDKAIEIYAQSQVMIDYISEQLRRVYRACERQRTIAGSNHIFYSALNKAKAKVFNEYNGIYKPHVVYRVNKYFQI